MAVQAVAVTAATIVAGRILTGPLRGFPAEDRLLHWMVARRSPGLDRWATAVSDASGIVSGLTQVAITGALAGYVPVGPGGAARPARAGAGETAARRRWNWRPAVAPLAAIALETAVFVSAAAVVRRPRPSVERIGYEYRTSSFPSGHTGAAVALYRTWATLLDRTGHPLARPAGPLLRVAAPAVVAHARLHCAMHHPTDVAAGVLIGAWSARAVERLLLH